MLHFFDPPEEFSYLTRDDPTQFAPPPAFGPFRVLHQVGVGALGPVFRTYEPTRDRLVAVKVFRLDITPEHAQSLADALSSAAEAGLFHPSVVEPIAAGVEGTVAYRAEEYVAAESLDVALRHYAPASLDKVLPFITQLAGAIDFARTAGVGHGALHPRDIFVTPEEARATGFGVVEALERVGLRAPVRRPYSAPERVEGRPWSTPADVFSLAAIAYELLTGRRPAGTGSQIGPLTEFTGDHGDAIHAVLAQAMDDDPAARFPSGLAFAAALEAAARGDRERESSSPAAVPAAAAAALPMASAAMADQPAADVTDDEIEESVADMPAPVVLDEQEEPAEVALEEETFRADQPAFDDVLGEPELLDRPEEDFALRDITLPVAEERFASDFDPKTIDRNEDVARQEIAAPPEPQEVHEEREERFVPPVTVAPTRGYSSITEPEVTAERTRPAILPYALVGILTSLLGFGAGYAYATRKATQNAAAVTPTSQQPQGKEFSEQTVAPPPASQPGAEPSGAPRDTPTPASEPSGPTTAPTVPGKPAARTTGTITITSTPAKAAVTVDGKWSGRTPLTLDNLKFGTYTIRIIEDGYRVERHVVPINAQLPERTISARLEPTASTTKPTRPPAATGTGSLYVDSRPRGARVIIDGKFVGVTPLQLADVAAGRRAVRLELPDHQTWRTTATIVPGRENRVTGSLDRIR